MDVRLLSRSKMIKAKNTLMKETNLDQSCGQRECVFQPFIQTPALRCTMRGLQLERNEFAFIHDFTEKLVHVLMLTAFFLVFLLQ